MHVTDKKHKIEPRFVPIYVLTLTALFAIILISIVQWSGYYQWTALVGEISVVDSMMSSEILITDSMIVQGILLLGAVCGIFGIIEEKGRFLLTVVLALGCSFLTLLYGILGMSDLLAASVPALYALATIAVVYRYRESLNKMLLVMTPMLALLLTMGSMGLVYASVVVLYLFIVAIRYRRTSTSKVVTQYNEIEIYSQDSGILIALKVIAATMISVIPIVVLDLCGIVKLEMIESLEQSMIVSAGIFLWCAITMLITLYIEASFCYRLGEVEDYRAFRSVRTKKRYYMGIVVCIILLIAVLVIAYNGFITIEIISDFADYIQVYLMK